MTNWSILYRGPLSSCNYECSYCPFAKTHNTAAELRDDAERLARFTEWVESRQERIGILFTPWGEALHHRAYQEAITRLSHLPNVRRVAIQTNLAAPLDWLKQANSATVALWATYHPTQVTRARFLAQCRKLETMQIRHSVGVVGLAEQQGEIEALRAELNPATYLWINAFKDQPDYYNSEHLAALSAIDPLFPTNTLYHPSRGKSCRAGHTSFTVDGAGNVRRCHFIKAVLGNIYRSDMAEILQPRPCTNDTCGCHIGYVYLEALRQDAVYGEGILERIPLSF